MSMIINMWCTVEVPSSNLGSRTFFLQTFISTQYKRYSMKTMTCKQLGGACDKKFHAETFEEMAALSKQHVMEMFQAQDEAHLKVMAEMKELAKDPNNMKEWMEKKKAEFDALPNN